jgi:iron complex transport system substrate-binding protein
MLCKRMLPRLCILCLTACAAAPMKTGDALPSHVAVINGSFAELWMLAGGTVSAVTEDAWQERALDLPENVINLGAMKSPNMELLLAGGYDLVILSSAVPGHTEIGQTLEKAGVRTLFLTVETFDDYLTALSICTDLTGHPENYETYGENLREKVDAQKARTTGHPEVLLLRAYATGVRAKGSDNMVGAMLKDLGCVNIADSDASLLEELSIEGIVARDPEFIFITAMGDAEEAAAYVKETLMENPAWQGLRAVKEGHVAYLPKELFHYKPNARWDEAYRILADILNAA